VNRARRALRVLNTDDGTSLGTVVICTALDEEYRAVREHLTGPFHQSEERGTLYEVATFRPDQGGHWDVVLTQTSAGNTPAGVHLERAVTRFHPQIALFVGVAGGLKDVRLGDVVIADYVYDYEAGKDTAAGYYPRIKTATATYRLVQRAIQVARTDGWRRRILPAPPKTAPTALVKPIAAGSKVVADRRAQIAAFLREHCGDAVAVEMEGHGFLYGAYVNNDVDALVVRGVSDLLTDKTEAADKHWQPVASRHAAAFAFELLNRLPAAGAGIPDPARQDATAVREVTASNLLALDEHATLPGAPEKLAVEREELRTLLKVDGSFVLTGEPGCGKSGVLSRLAHHLIKTGEDVVVLTVDSLGTQPGAIRDDVVLTKPLLAVLRDWPGESRATLLIDGLDATRGGPLTWLVNLIRHLGGTRWRTIATMRHFDLRHSSAWTQAFPGAPVSDRPEHRDDDLPGVRHFLLGNFSVDELKKLAKDHPGVGRLIADASDHLIDLILNPFNLRLACELLDTGVSEASLADSRDQLELLQKYWRVRVTQHPSSEARLRVLERLSRAMLKQRTLRTNSRSVPEALLDARTGLVQDGVLQELPGRLKASGSPSLAYSHHILFDYGVAALILTDGDESLLMPRLEQDPNLVLIARPSIDLHLADLWHVDDDHCTFAAVVAELVRHGDSLAGVAAVRVVVSEAEAEADLRWLTDLSTGHTAVFSTIAGWIAAMLDAADEGVQLRIRERLEIWATVLEKAAAQVAHDFDIQLVNQTYRLQVQLDKLQTMLPGTRAAPAWADSVAVLMRAALVAPAEHERLATMVARFLPRAVAINPVHASIMRQTLRPEIMVLWQSHYLHHYVDAVDAIATGDPELARDVLVAVLRFEDDRDDVTPLSQGVLALTSTRRQDVDMAKYAVGQRLSAFIAVTGLGHAVEVLAEALHLRGGEPDGNLSGYPISVRSVRGQVDIFGLDLQYGPGHGVAKQIATEFAAALRDLDLAITDLGAIVEELVRTIRHPEAWRLILTAASSRPAELGRAFLPVLLAGGLFAHSGTRAAAGTLVQAVDPLLTDAEHADLERAILSAAHLLKPPSDDAADRLLDQLSGCLMPGKIQDATLAERVSQQSENGGPPAIPEPQAPVASFMPTTLREYLGADEYAQLTDQQREALDTLRLTLDALTATPSQEQAAEAEQVLRHALATGIVSADHLGPGAEIVFRGIEAVVRVSPPAPDSELATLIMPLLLGAIRSDGAADEEGPIA
jgi:nucleoside phosphorylase